MDVSPGLFLIRSPRTSSISTQFAEEPTFARRLTKYLENSLDALRAGGQRIPSELARHLAPLGWEHVSLTGDYTWSSSDQPQRGQLRPLRRSQSLLAA